MTCWNESARGLLATCSGSMTCPMRRCCDGSTVSAAYLVDLGRGDPSIAEHAAAIKAELREYLTGRRGDLEREPDPAAPGLGLAIASWIVDIHGGKIELISSDDNGSSFRVEFVRDGMKNRPRRARHDPGSLPGSTVKPLRHLKSSGFFKQTGQNRYKKARENSIFL